MLAAVPALALLVIGGGWARERWQTSRLPAAAGGAPNILLIVWDTVRDLNLSLYGYERPTTPHLVERAREGVLFTNAFSPSSWTLQSHAAMFTGRHAAELDATWFHPLTQPFPTLAQALSDAGYVTAGFTANVTYTSRETGITRGFLHYEDYPVRFREIFRSTWLGRTLTGTPFGRRLIGIRPGEPVWLKTSDDINRETLAWFAGSGPDRPRFAFLNYLDAHHFYAPPPFKGRFGGDDKEGLWKHSDKKPWTVEEAQPIQNRYDEALLYMDDRLDQLLDSLGRLGVLDNAIVVFTADHGEEFGEHGVISHGHTVYRPAVEVPLLVIAPGRAPRGVIVDAPVSNSDLAATILALAGVAASDPPGGQSFADRWSPAKARDSIPESPILVSQIQTLNRPEWYPAMKGSLRSIAVGRYRYSRIVETGEEELFDFVRDTMELTNLAGDPAYAPALTVARAALREEDPGAFETPAP